MFLDLNINKSKECVNKNSYIEKNNCYMNVYQLTLSYLRKNIMNNNIKIAYGYIGRYIGDNYTYFRHCFFVDKNNKVIDPTLYKTSYNEEKEIVKYVIVKNFDFQEYIDILSSNKGNLDLQDYLKNMEIKIVEELQLNVNPIDLYYLNKNEK